MKVKALRALTLLALVIGGSAVAAPVAQAYEVKIVVRGHGVVDEITSANLAYCSSPATTPTGTVGNTCTAGSPSGDYGWAWEVKLNSYVLASEHGWSFEGWRGFSDDSHRPVDCEGAEDASGLNTAEVCRFWTYDNLAIEAIFKDTADPNTSIGTVPYGETNTGAHFTFGATQTGSTFECSLDSAAYAACSSPKEYSNLGDGNHTFAVRATDPSGNLDDTPASHTWLIKVPPTAPSAPWKTGSTQSSLSVSWGQSTDGTGNLAGYNVFVNNVQAATTSATNHTLVGLGCGTTYTIGVQAYDSAGNTSARLSSSLSTSACDADGDGVANATDNCRDVANADQKNSDADAQGDACDADDDNDTVLDAADNCRVVANQPQTDTDGDGAGNACDADDDGDTIADTADNCALTPNPDQADADSDGQGNACDTTPNGPRRTLTVVLSGEGSVTSSPAGISCPGDCSQEFAADTDVVLTATPAAGSSFVNWEWCNGDGTNRPANQCLVQVREGDDLTTTAFFDRTRHDLTLTVGPALRGERGMVEVDAPSVPAERGPDPSMPPSNVCPQSCLYPVIEGEIAKLTAQPVPGFVFKGWSGACTSKTLVCNVAMNADKNVSATFVPATLRVSDVRITEGNSGKKSAVFKVSLPGVSDDSIGVRFFTANGTAKAPGDYVARPSTRLTFLKGQRSKAVSVSVVGERRRESNETFFLKLKNPTGATIADPVGKATIVNND